MKFYCNPINARYLYQFSIDPSNEGKQIICREAADPSMIFFRGRYYIFASMTLGVWVSDDLVRWENHFLSEELPLYGYAPDVRVMGEWVYFCASCQTKPVDFWRTKDILNGPYEKIPGSIPCTDPNVFVDDDGRVYFYWGCSNIAPIWGVELDRETMLPIGEPVGLIEGRPLEIGYERIGEDNSIRPLTDDETEASYFDYVKRQGLSDETLSPKDRSRIRGMFANKPFIEGAWMDKHKSKYYLQYAAPGTQFNTYSDGVYVGESPLDPFVLAENNPISYKPGGFLPGAGHGSTMRDAHGGLWHAATMRISVNHPFERRVGIWPAGFDRDGALFVNQRYGDWPMATQGDPLRDPEWMLLSVGKHAYSSSCTEGHAPENAIREDVRTWWQAKSNRPDEWIMVDLGKEYDVHAVQINFADNGIDVPCPGDIRQCSQPRYIDGAARTTRWLLEGSPDGESWFTVEDKTSAQTDLSHDLIVKEQGFFARFLRLSRISVPYGQNPCVSGLRIFGLGDGEKPDAPDYLAQRDGALDMTVDIRPVENALGYNILFGSAPDKLYSSSMVFAPHQHRVGALIQDRRYYVRVDAFNENGITQGKCVRL